MVGSLRSPPPAGLRAWLLGLDPHGLLRLSAAGAVVTIALKTLAWWVSDSVGLLSDALESLVNLAGALFALAMVTIAARPADDDHPYGHHKAEYFSSGFEGMLVLGAALAILWAAAHRLMVPRPIEQVGWGLTLSLASTVLNGALAWLLLRAAKLHRSAALQGDGRHLVTDVWTSVGVMAGITAVHFTGWLWLDPLVAAGVALNILREGTRMVWSASQGLMDEAVEPDALARIQATLDGFAARHGEAVRIDHLRTRRAGQRRFADVHMHLPPEWPVSRAVALRNTLEAALMQAVPGLRASIQLLSSDTEAHLDEMPAPHPHAQDSATASRKSGPGPT